MPKLKKLPYYKKVKQKLMEISPLIFIDVAADIINEKIYNRFKRFIPPSFRGSYQQGIAMLVAMILKEAEDWEEILFQIAKLNATYLENSNYLSFSQEQLKGAFEDKQVPSLHGTGVTPEMLIFYYYSKHKFNHKDIPFLIEKWEEASKEIEKEQKRIANKIKLQPPLSGSQAEFELNQFAFERGLKSPIQHERMHEIAQTLEGSYDEKSKTVTLKRGVAYFFYTKLKELIDAQEWYDRVLRLLFKETDAFNRQVERVKQIQKEREKLKDENTKLKKKIKQLEHEKANLLALKKEKPSELEKENAELKKKLSHALSRIEQLEEQIAILEQAREINKEIEENLPIIQPEKKIEIPDYGFVVISGGKWNSRTKGEVEQFFAEYGIETEFIPAEDTLKRQDRIANADLVVFDTSRHAHKYYNKIKELNGNILHIRKSDLGEIEKLFEKGE